MTGAQIVTPNNEQARFVAKIAKEMGLDIRPPISYETINHHPGHFEKILLDNAEEIIEKLLDQYFRGELVTATVSFPIEMRAREENKHE